MWGEAYHKQLAGMSSGSNERPTSPAARSSLLRRRLLLAAASLTFLPSARGQSLQDTIARVKRSVVAVGTSLASRAPPFLFRGTGFGVADGTLVATNAHVLPDIDATKGSLEQLVVALPTGANGSTQVHTVEGVVAVDREHDLALLRIPGPPLPPLRVIDSGTMRDGDSLLITGFPRGTVLGVFPATHRALLAATVPIVIPPGNSSQLDSTKVRQLQAGAFDIFQLDAIVHPGNSGSPVYDPMSGDVVGVMSLAVVRRLKEGQETSPSGIAYAIPAIHLLNLIATVKPR
jgi:S1-C subfamily serine protease